MYSALSASVGWSFLARRVNDSLKFNEYTQERKVGVKMGIRRFFRTIFHFPVSRLRSVRLPSSPIPMVTRYGKNFSYAFNFH